MSTNILTDPIIVDAPVHQNQLKKNNVAQARIDDTEPSVKNLDALVFVNGITTNVVNFKDGQEGQTIKVLGDGKTAVINGAKLKTNTGADKLLIDLRVYKFTLFNSIWCEDA